MITQLVITDLTRMQHGHVCIAGYDAKKACIRLVQPPPGISEAALIENDKAIAFPFAVVEADLQETQSDPPHTEDHLYAPGSLHYARHAVEAKIETVLSWSLYKTVAALFGQPILEDPGHYVLAGQGERSLGTIQPRAIRCVEYHEGLEGVWDYRISFKDDEHWYTLKITDLTWHYYCDQLRAGGREPVEIATELTAMLRRRKVYVRVGLSRGWKKYPGRCFLQVNGIHTIPDYLEGRTFVDLKRSSSEQIL